jgi:hypothetical protein
VESVETRRNWRGRRRGEDEGVLVGVVGGVGGIVLFDRMGDERMVNVAAGRPVRRKEVVFMFSGRSVGSGWESSFAMWIVAMVKLDR